MGGTGGFVCSVKDCKNATSNTKKVSFFRFPKDLQRTEQWLKLCRCIKSPLKKLHVNYRVCGEHFTSSMFLNDLKNRLQPHAVPTINLSANLESLSEVSRMPMQDAVVNYPNIEDKNKKSLLCFSQEAVEMQQIKTIKRANSMPNQNNATDEIHFNSTEKRLKTDAIQNVLTNSTINTHKPNNHTISVKYIINKTYYPQETEETDIRKEKTDAKAEEASVRQEEIEKTSHENNREDTTTQLKMQKLEEENIKLQDLIQSLQEKYENDLKNQANALNVIIQENQMEFQQKLALKNKELKLLRMKMKRKDDIIYKLLTTRTE